MSPTSELGFFFTVSHFGSGWTSPGFTFTRDFLVFPGLTGIHCALARVAAAEAVVGIAEFSPVGSRQTVVISNHADWPPFLFRRIGHFTIGLHVVQGTMKGCLFLQGWS